MSPAPTAWTTWDEAARMLLRGATMRVAGPVAAFVGTVLSLVNQGAVVLGGDASAATWVRVAVNYFTPFLVTSVGFLSGRRVRVERDAGPRG